jgi:hypothetical protein
VVRVLDKTSCGVITFRPLSVCPRSYCPGRFVPQYTSSPLSLSPLSSFPGHFAPWSFCPLVISSPRERNPVSTKCKFLHTHYLRVVAGSLQCVWWQMYNGPTCDMCHTCDKCYFWNTCGPDLKFNYFNLSTPSSGDKCDQWTSKNLIIWRANTQYCRGIFILLTWPKRLNIHF